MITHFELGDEHREQRTAVREFCEEHVDPHVEAHESSGTFPREIVEAVGEAGLHGVPFPAEYGGADEDYRSFAITVEELARSWKLLAGTVSGACCLVGYPLNEFGSEWQREEWLGELATGRSIAALSLTEPEAGSDAGSLRTTAERDGDEWVIDGHKVWTTNGAVADLILVVARTNEYDDYRGLSLIGVPNPLERDGVEVVRDIPCMEGEAAVESEIRYDDVRVPVENLVGEEGKGFRYIMEGLDIGRIGTAAQGVGVAQAAFEASRAFADEREQFGRPIREFQGIGFKLADMATEVEAARLLTLHAAAERDRGQRVTREAAMAKTKATDVAMDAATEAVQIHGSRGYSKDYPVERYMRVAKGMQIYEGTNEVNRIVISNQLYE
ncbi:acyl-CoA dehydrogenase family protein [Halomarina halobia]|uniref:Acyl-CoA dehydrogenase family protein n=1 Tax=Halomarina halobia TaxID=3033386 RepID=A0ABD6ADN3_9EURY|nr:acyl-CoA dehydrogenase family protein [Halomarina sp. PSR21]